MGIHASVNVLEEVRLSFLRYRYPALTERQFNRVLLSLRSIIMATCPVCGKTTSVWTCEYSTGRCPECYKANRTVSEHGQQCHHCKGTTFCGGHLKPDGTLTFAPACATCKMKSGLPLEKDIEKVICSVCQGKGSTQDMVNQPPAPTSKQQNPTEIIKGLVGLIIVGLVLWFTWGFWKNVFPNLQWPNQNAPNDAALGTVPRSQADFVKVVESFYQPFKDAPNELKKSALRDERRKAIEKVLPDRVSKDWIGTLDAMTTTREGKAHIAVRLGGSNVVVTTWNNVLSDMLDRTLIEHDTPLYNAFAKLSKGDVVRFSGTFILGGNALDYVKEKSLTEDGSMTSPAFVFVFTDVAKK